MFLYLCACMCVFLCVFCVCVSHNCQSGKRVFLLAQLLSLACSLSLSLLPPHLHLLDSFVCPAQASFSTRMSFIHAFGPLLHFQLVAKYSFLKFNRVDKLKKIN